MNQRQKQSRKEILFSDLKTEKWKEHEKNAQDILNSLGFKNIETWKDKSKDELEDELKKLKKEAYVYENKKFK